MDITLVLLTILFVLLIYGWNWLRKHFQYWDDLNIACDPPNWIAGNLKGAVTAKTFTQIWQEYYDKYKDSGPFAGFFWFTKPGIFALDPNLIKHILIKDFAKFTDRGLYCNEEDDPLTGSLNTLDGQKWRQMRNKISPTFTSSKMKTMLPLVLKEAQELVQVLEDMSLENAIVEVRELLSRFTTNVIGSCAFGIEINTVRNPDDKFRTMCRRAMSEQRFGVTFRVTLPSLAKRLHMKQTLPDVEEYFMGLITKTVECREQTKVRRNDFIDLLIDLKNNKSMKSESASDELTNLTFGQLAAQAFSFLLAGNETSSTAMSFALYELAQNQRVQQRARDEIIRVLEKHQQDFSYECLKDMVYVDQIMKETLRLYSSLSVLNRSALEDYVVPGNPKYVIKKGMPVLIPAAAIHRDERYYPQPNVFNPDNFSPEMVKERDSILYLPFGEGPRNCVGMRFGKMQVIIGLALMLKNFKFSVCDKTTIPMVYDKRSFLTCPAEGIYLRVEKV
ncbi:probable cytochrome P450 6a21 isoform X1 [Stomoxys calcitrans]|uniref:Cytochrome P450 n=1 Tax=Stomoxys calcitrans TaxID=35570 RepID=A0A1I8NN26_STOCA|nr:probable cytochrome P450 6a21 isoform X1 [Stomoxys calcitrans]